MVRIFGVAEPRIYKDWKTDIENAPAKADISGDEYMNRVISAWVGRLRFNINKPTELAEQVVSADPLQRPIALINGVVTGIKERVDMNSRRIEKIKENISTLGVR